MRDFYVIIRTHPLPPNLRKIYNNNINIKESYLRNINSRNLSVKNKKQIIKNMKMKLIHPYKNITKLNLYTYTYNFFS